jgi:ATP-dependent DNA helicase DinG
VADDPTAAVVALLDAAVDAIGGTPRPGQQAMAEAVAEAFETKRHLLVQAGTGTGKSLAYLVPAVVRALRDDDADGPVVVATATLALQSQLVERDLPGLAPVAEAVLDRPFTWAVAKGRSNYACLHRVREGAPRRRRRPHAGGAGGRCGGARTRGRRISPLG